MLLLSTRLLSTERLITQFEITTSMELSGSGIFSISPFRNSTFSTPALLLVLPSQRQHLVSHVEAVDFTGRPHLLRREKYVNASARAEVKYYLARPQFSERGRISAAERGHDRSSRNSGGVALAVDFVRHPRGLRNSCGSLRPAAWPCPFEDAKSSLAILLLYLVLYIHLGSPEGSNNMVPRVLLSIEQMQSHHALLHMNSFSTHVAPRLHVSW